jgi:hypothetical protein
MPRIARRRESLAHPMRVHFALRCGSHNRNKSRQTTENLTIGVAVKHCQASHYFRKASVSLRANLRFRCTKSRRVIAQ